jgi:hypothetical protein
MATLVTDTSLGAITRISMDSTERLSPQAMTSSTGRPPSTGGYASRGAGYPIETPAATPTPSGVRRHLFGM